MTSSKSIAAAVVILVLIAGAAYLYTQNQSAVTATNTPPATTVDATKEQVTTPTDTSTGTPTPVPTPTPTPVTAASPYKDGTYTANGSYQTPESIEQITVTLTLKAGVVTDASITGVPQARESQRFQSQFIANFKSLVIGKNISTLSLSHVSGSSLTSGGFNNAVAKIKAQAQA